MVRHFYAQSDFFTGDYPAECTRGFANCRCAIAFSTRKDRDMWVRDTLLLTAKPLTRAEAVRMTRWTVDHRGDYVKSVSLCGTDDTIIIARK